eukprot:gene22270-36039_t
MPAQTPACSTTSRWHVEYRSPARRAPTLLHALNHPRGPRRHRHLRHLHHDEVTVRCARSTPARDAGRATRGYACGCPQRGVGERG